MRGAIRNPRRSLSRMKKSLRRGCACCTDRRELRRPRSPPEAYDARPGSDERLFKNNNTSDETPAPHFNAGHGPATVGARDSLYGHAREPHRPHPATARASILVRWPHSGTSAQFVSSENTRVTLSNVSSLRLRQQARARRCGAGAADLLSSRPGPCRRACGKEGPHFRSGGAPDPRAIPRSALAALAPRRLRSPRLTLSLSLAPLASPGMAPEQQPQA